MLWTLNSRDGPAAAHDLPWCFMDVWECCWVWLAEHPQSFRGRILVPGVLWCSWCVARSPTMCGIKAAGFVVLSKHHGPTQHELPSKAASSKHLLQEAKCAWPQDTMQRHCISKLSAFFGCVGVLADVLSVAYSGWQQPAKRLLSATHCWSGTKGPAHHINAWHVGLADPPAPHCALRLACQLCPPPSST